MKYWLYILKCSDGSYYTGTTVGLQLRLAEHEAGTVPGYTESRRPVKLVFSEQFPDSLSAFEMERRIKGWSRAKKEALIKGDFELLHELARCRNKSRR